MLIPKSQYIRDRKHLVFLRSLPCIVCGGSPSEAAHMPKINGKGGMGLKVSDCNTLSLCHWHHMQSHGIHPQTGVKSERQFWEGLGIERCLMLAQAIYSHKHDHAYCSRAVIEFNKRS